MQKIVLMDEGADGPGKEDALKDTDIIELYFARDEAAIAETDKKYGAYCMSIARQILNSTPDAEECLSDTYLKTWNAIPPERPHDLKAFLGCIIRRLSLDRYRSLHTAKRNKNLEVAFEELSECVPVKDEDTGYLRELLDEFLEGLDPKVRVTFMRRYWFALSPAQIAGLEKCSINAVVVRLYKTRNKLREFLTERGYHI